VPRPRVSFPEAIIAALREHRNVMEAAKSLGCSETAFRARARRSGVDVAYELTSIGRAPVPVQPYTLPALPPPAGTFVNTDGGALVTMALADYMLLRDRAASANVSPTILAELEQANRIIAILTRELERHQ
jgi:hypothetical protein